MSGTPELLLGPEGYYGASVAVAPDGTFALTTYAPDSDNGKRVVLGVYSPEGRPLWNRTVTGNAGAEETLLAAPAGGDVLLWVHLANGGDFGTGPTQFSYALVRYAPGGSVLWARDVHCGPGSLPLDDSGALMVAQNTCRSDVPMTVFQRVTPSGEVEFELPMRQLGLWGSAEMNTDGEILLGGMTPPEDQEFGVPKWISIGRDGAPRSSGTLRGLYGSLYPIHLSEEGQYLALLTVDRGTGRFAGQPVECVPGADIRCEALLLSGNVEGREDSVAVFPRHERVIWVSPSREIVTLARDEAGTGSILRRRSSTARLLETYALTSRGPGRAPDADVRVTQVSPHPDGSLMVLGMLEGKADLAGTPAESDSSRLFLLRLTL